LAASTAGETSSRPGILHACGRGVKGETKKAAREREEGYSPSAYFPRDQKALKDGNAVTTGRTGSRKKRRK